MTEATVRCPAISCGHCANTIRGELSDAPGVRAVDVDVAAKTVTVRFDAPATWPALAAILADIGFPPDPA
jgi:copper chaperone CopZ